MGGVNLGRLLDGLAAAHWGGVERTGYVPGAFSGEVDTGTREKNASKSKKQDPVLIPSEPKGSL
jgi:hypothetical protein